MIQPVQVDPSLLELHYHQVVPEVQSVQGDLAAH